MDWAWKLDGEGKRDRDGGSWRNDTVTHYFISQAATECLEQSISI